jgi:hypothetical protein
MSSNSSPALIEPSFQKLLALLALVWLAIFIIALSGYPDLTGNERRVSGYVLDAVQNGHWMIQRDAMGDVASKPPLLTWLISGMTLLMGRLTLFGMYLPSALATLGTAWAILYAGRKHFGWFAGFLAALTYLLSPATDSQLTTVRYDGLFTFPVLLGALAAFRAWNLGCGWTWFWLAVAMSTLVKGPLGPVLSATGLFAAIWEWRSGNPLRPRGNHLAGIGLFFLICGGWFALAYWQMGQPLIDKMIGRELVQHSLSSEEGGVGGGFYEPTLNVLTNYLPWSPLALIALWRVWKKPATSAETRRFERFLFCWFVVGLIMFSISPHQRGRLILPLLPAVALLTGRELSRWLVNWSAAKFWKTVAGASAVGFVLFAVQHHVVLARDKHVKDTLALRAMAGDIRAQVGEQFPLTHVDCPSGLQIYLNTYRPWISTTQAVELLCGEAAAFLVVRNVDELQKALGTNAPPVYEFLPAKMHDGFSVRIISNHPKLEWTDSMSAIIGPLQLRMDSMKLLRQTGDDLVFERNPQAKSQVTITNISDEMQRVRVQFADGSEGPWQERRLAPGEAWHL